MASLSRTIVAINVPLSSGVSGGVEQATVGLVHALGKLEGPEEYVLVLPSQQQADWLRQYSGPNQRMVIRPRLGSWSGSEPENGERVGLTKAIKFALGPLLPTARYVQHLLSTPRRWPEIPVSDGFFESLGCDVLHFPTQAFVLCSLPTIFNPHDLQHLHYPQFFTHEELIDRETIYPAGCRYAHTVVVGTQWVKDDVVRSYGTNPAKVQVIPWASPTDFYKQPSDEDLSAVPAKYGIDGPFAIYPAATWPHKNHLRLLEALARLRDSHGLVVRLICTGSRERTFWPRIESRIRELNLQTQVRFLGFVAEEDLRALYRLAQFLVLPTLYEADSCPIFEAWSEGLPVVSSNVTALPDQIRDAGLLFDPNDVASMASAIARMATDSDLQDGMRERGYRRVGDFDWDRTARAYRSVYRRAANVPLTEEDRWLLEWDWMRHPEQAVV